MIELGWVTCVVAHCTFWCPQPRPPTFIRQCRRRTKTTVMPWCTTVEALTLKHCCKCGGDKSVSH